MGAVQNQAQGGRAGLLSDHVGGSCQGHAVAQQQGQLTPEHGDFHGRHAQLDFLIRVEFAGQIREPAGRHQSATGRRKQNRLPCPGRLSKSMIP